MNAGNHHTIFIDTCPDCGGDGGFESRPSGYDHTNGNPITHWIKCRACDGSGEIETEHECRTLEDIEEEDAERADGLRVVQPETTSHAPKGTP